MYLRNLGTPGYTSILHKITSSCPKRFPSGRLQRNIKASDNQIFMPNNKKWKVAL